MKLYLLGLILISYSSFGITFKALGRNHDFINLGEVNYSANCALKCKAQEAVRTKIPNIIDNQKSFKTRIGSVLCRDVWKEVSLIGINENGDQTALCLFSDQSMVDLDSLSRKLETN